MDAAVPPDSPAGGMGMGRGGRAVGGPVVSRPGDAVGDGGRDRSSRALCQVGELSSRFRLTDVSVFPRRF